MTWREVTIHLTSGCGSPFIHQPFYLQLSIGNRWVPPTPLRFPPKQFRPDGKPDNSPATDVYDIAYTLWSLLYNDKDTAVSSGIRRLGSRAKPGEDDYGGRNREIDSITFSTREKEVDYSLVGVEVKANGKETQGTTQLQMAVEVAPGEGEFAVKRVKSKVLFDHWHTEGRRRKGWGDKRPHDVKFDAVRFGPAGGVFGDKLFSLGWHDPGCAGHHEIQLASGPVTPFVSDPTEHWLSAYQKTWHRPPTFLETMQGQAGSRRAHESTLPRETTTIEEPRPANDHAP